VLVYGDTNSTLAGALAAAKLRVPLAHVEAGLRSFNREMPEEHNRVLADHCSDLLFCPTRTAVVNLGREGIERGIQLVGDTMYDAVLEFSEIARNRSTVLRAQRVAPREYLLATVHRPYNTDNPHHLAEILGAFLEIGEPVIFPVHPRTKQRIAELDDYLPKLSTSKVRLIDPVGYLDMLVLEQHAKVILTDSGGIQKEAYFLGVPCVTLRPETEWIETVHDGWNVVVGSERSVIVQQAFAMQASPKEKPSAFGDGHAAERIIKTLADHHRS
jgi:UDP-N-acetylglucosamine 2-epimerase